MKNYCIFCGNRLVGGSCECADYRAYYGGGAGDIARREDLSDRRDRFADSVHSHVIPDTGATVYLNVDPSDAIGGGFVGRGPSSSGAIGGGSVGRGHSGGLGGGLGGHGSSDGFKIPEGPDPGEKKAGGSSAGLIINVSGEKKSSAVSDDAHFKAGGNL